MTPSRTATQVAVGVVHLPSTPQDAAALAHTAEAAGVGWFGVADSPVVYGALYPVIQRVLDATTTLRVGPLVTNPVTRHASVHAATIVAFEALYPGRTFFGISSGDSAVHAVGLRPGRPTDVAATVDAVRVATGGEVPVLTAVGGPRAAAGVAAGSNVLYGCGLDDEATLRLAAAVPPPARRGWSFVQSSLDDEGGHALTAVDDIRSAVVAFSRHALAADPVSRGVPTDLAQSLTELYREYDFTAHSRGPVNGALLDRHPAVARYLLERFAVVGTVADAAARIETFAASTGVKGVFLGTGVCDPHAHVRRAGALARALMHEQAVAT